MFGGVDINGNLLKDAWIYSYDMGWHEIIPALLTLEQPAKVDGPELATISSNSIIMFGGYASGSIGNNYNQLEPIRINQNQLESIRIN